MRTLRFGVAHGTPIRHSTEVKAFDSNYITREWEDYSEQFEIWHLVENNLSAEETTAFFQHFIGKYWYALLKNLAFLSSPMKLSFEGLKWLLLRYFSPVNFVVAERIILNMLIPAENHFAWGFVIELQTQESKCDYDAHLDRQLRYPLIDGINMPELRQRLLLLQDYSE